VLAAGALRLGRLVTFIPWPVVEGFTLGIACVIFLQQVPSTVGVPAEAGLNPAVAAWRSVVAAVTSADGIMLWTLGAAGVVAVVMIVLQRTAPAVPASLVGVALVTVLAEVLDAPIDRIGALPDSLPLPLLPSTSAGALRDLVGAAFAIAALAAIESLLSARVASTMTSHDGAVYHPDRELVGQGLASVASGLFGGMPATGAIARTAVNVRSGARTRLAAVIHALVILAVIYLATGPVGRIPLAALAGVLMITTTRMIPARTVMQVVRASRGTALTFAITAVITVAFDLIEAVQIGVLVAAFFTLRSIAGAAGVHREPLPGPAQPGDEHIALFRLDGAMFFGASDRLLTQVSRDSLRDGVSVVVLRLSGLRMIDATGAKALAELVHELEHRGIMVLVKGVKPGHLGLLRTVGVLDELRDERHVFATLEEAIAHARAHTNTGDYLASA
jgi:SulP family sulfate permease